MKTSQTTNTQKKENIPEGLKMYFDYQIAKNFAALEQNEKNFRVAEIMDRIIMSEIENKETPIYAAELGGGAHPDRYHKFFAKLLKNPRSRIDWVDISPFMLRLALEYINQPEYQERKERIKFIENDIYKYLENLYPECLDLAIMKYTLNYLRDLERLFKLLSLKLKSGGVLVATAEMLDAKLKSISTNARFLYNGKEFAANETRILKDGDSFTIKFFNKSGEPKSGYLNGAEVTEYFHSKEKTEKLAKKYGFKIFLGDWKNLIPEEKRGGETIGQNIIVLWKKA